MPALKEDTDPVHVGGEIVTDLCFLYKFSFQGWLAGGVGANHLQLIQN